MKILKRWIFLENRVCIEVITLEVYENYCCWWRKGRNGPLSLPSLKTTMLFWSKKTNPFSTILLLNGLIIGDFRNGANFKVLEHRCFLKTAISSGSADRIRRSETCFAVLAKNGSQRNHRSGKNRNIPPYSRKYSLASPCQSGIADSSLYCYNIIDLPNALSVEPFANGRKAWWGLRSAR